MEKLLGVIPAYFEDLLGLITGPKRFAVRQVAEEPRIERALLFLGLSFALSFILKVPLLRGDLWLELAISAAWAA